MNNDDPQNASQNDPQSETPQADGFSDFDPDAYLARRLGGQYGRPKDRVETVQSRLRRSKSGADDDLITSGSDAISGIEPDMDGVKLLANDARPIIKYGTLVFGCIALTLLLGLCGFSAWLLISLITR